MFFSEIGLSEEEAEKLASFLALTHDLGKATPAFQDKILQALPILRQEQETLGVNISTTLDKVLHARAGAMLLYEAGLDESLACIISAHHGRPDDNFVCDQEDATEEIKDKPRYYGKRGSLWQDIQGCFIRGALRQSNYSSLADIPAVTRPAQLLLSGLLIMADWLSSNERYFCLISTEERPLHYDETRIIEAIKKIDLPSALLLDDDWKKEDFFSRRFSPKTKLNIEDKNDENNENNSDEDENCSSISEALTVVSPSLSKELAKEELAEVQTNEFVANAVQEKMMDIAKNTDNPGIIILEAPMGMGKTEASLAVAEILMNRFNLGGLAFFLPSQATSNAMFDRIISWLENQPETDEVTVQLAHSAAELNEHFFGLKQKEQNNRSLGKNDLVGQKQGYVSFNTIEKIHSEDEDEESKLIVHSWFRGRKTKLLANVVIGTIDQLLMAGLKQKHVMLRHLGLAGKVVVIDECHAYDAYMNTYLDRVLQWLGAYKVPVILLSATLPNKRRLELVKAYTNNKKIKVKSTGDIRKPELDYPRITYNDENDAKSIKIDPKLPEKKVSLKLIKENEEEEIINLVREVLSQGGCLGIILNTVKRVHKFANIIKNEINNEELPNFELIIDHSQFLLPERVRIEEEIVRKIGRDSTVSSRRNVVIIGTQVLEQSLDLDFDLLITDLAPMDLLLQRMGRLQRHQRIRPRGLSSPRSVILGADMDDLEPGAKAIYGEYLLERTLGVILEKDLSEIILPDDIYQLIQETYDEGKGEDLFPRSYEKYRLEYKDQQTRAKQFCLLPPKMLSTTIFGLLSNSPGFSDPQARAAVRDGVSSIDVIALRRSDEAKAEILSKQENSKSGSKQYSLTSQPSEEEVREILHQRLRLPSKFSQKYQIEKVLTELEAQTKETVPEWLFCPQLAHELFLFFDQNNQCVINKTKLTYNTDEGLILEELSEEE